VPNSDRLSPALAGIELEADGRIAVDEYGRTTAEGVWALGDVSSPYQLKHVANHEMRVVAHNLAYPDDLRKTDHRFVPSAVFSNPQLASAGATEAELVAAGTRYVTYHQDYGSTAYGWALEDTRSFVKLLADPASGQLLGAHLLGPDASSLIQILIQAMANGLSIRGLARSQYWIHPALAEVIENALLGIEALLDPAP
jgi:mycothione reductase